MSGCSEELEFLGDPVLNMIVTGEIMNQYGHIEKSITDAPYRMFPQGIDEGILTNIRSRFVCREYLAQRAEELGLDQFILYGSGKTASQSTMEDMMEALIGAVTIDSNQNRKAMENVTDRLLCLQLDHLNDLLEPSYYELFNSWHQRHFGRIPQYEITGPDPHGEYLCTLRYSIPENDQGIWTAQRTDWRAETRSKARETAAELAYYFVKGKGLWIRMADAGVVPDQENAINQLQELYQKKYLEEKPVYAFEEMKRDEWKCVCTAGGISASGYAGGKTKAKKKASFRVLVALLEGAGCCRDEWKDMTYFL